MVVAQYGRIFSIDVSTGEQGFYVDNQCALLSAIGTGIANVIHDE